MEKFSIYEFLSFVLPGALFLEVARWISCHIFAYCIFCSSFLGEGVVGGLIYLLFALIAGGLLHILTFRVIRCKSDWNYIRKAVYVEMQELTYLDFGEEDIFAVLNAEYRKKTGIKSDETDDDKKPMPYLFDFAYYQLELGDHLMQVKNFQSLYFLFRNLTILSIVFILFFFVILCLKVFDSSSIGSEASLLGYCIVGSIVFMVLVGIGARWFRQKMASRLFHTYYVYIKSKPSDYQ